MSPTGGDKQGQGRTGMNAPLRFALHLGGSSGLLPSFKDIEKAALKAGLLREVPYDPIRHFGLAGDYLKPGDTLCELSDLMRGPYESGGKAEAERYG